MRGNDALGWVGVAVGLGGYAFTSDLLYVLSSLMLGYVATKQRMWPFLGVNVAWGFMALYKLTAG